MKKILITSNATSAWTAWVLMYIVLQSTTPDNVLTCIVNIWTHPINFTVTLSAGSLKYFETPKIGVFYPRRDDYSDVRQTLSYPPYYTPSIVWRTIKCQIIPPWCAERLLPLLGSAQCNGINIIIISKE